MAQPLPKPNQPLLDVLALYGVTAAELDDILKDGADEIERLLPKLLEQHSTGGTVKAAQLMLVRRELRIFQSALWGELGRVIRGGVEASVVKAAEAAASVLGTALGRRNVRIPALDAAYVQQAKAGIPAVLAKAKSGIPLARSVYRSQALVTGQVDRKVSQGLLLGHNHKTIAKSVQAMVRPDVAGGVSYAAHRLARTEINHAYQTSQEMRYADEPWTTGMTWNLSKSHPAPDICNVLATRDVYGLGVGAYPLGKRPDSHPNCLCYQTPLEIDEDEFVDRFVAGEYNAYLDDKIYTHAPASELLCP
jgi:hypothetical protein